MFLFGAGKSVKQKLIFDIGSSRVNCVLASFGSGEKIDVKRLFRSENVIMPEVNLRGLWRKIYALIENVMWEYEKSGRKADEAMVVFSSPWYFSDSRLVSKKFDPPIVIDKKFIAEIMLAQENSFKKDTSSYFGFLQEDLALTRSLIMSAKLNGYPVREPRQNILGKRAVEFFVSIYISAIFSEAAAGIKKLLENHGVKSTEFRSSPRVLFDIFLREGYKDLFVVDIGGEITDLILIKGGQMLKMASFGRGINYVARRVGSALRLDLNEVSELISNYMENKLDDKFKRSLEVVLKEAVKEWQNLFKEALEKRVLPDLAPEKIMLTGHGKISAFHEALSDPSFKRYTAHGRSFSIIEQTSDKMKGFFKNYDQILDKPYLDLIGFYLIYAANYAAK
ncbi:MAG: hypothetical protein HYY55_01165 [Candidatus Niyogibacteria bacterium]|nr:MAG: hypothetical protein HYY55_01165 [Candidatus Niyogibacteria bacterium]